MPSPNKIFLTVIIPCYNEQKNLQRGVLDYVAAFLDQQNYGWEVLISDDGSSDDSKKLLKKFKHPRFRLLENEHGGKAQALYAGLQHAGGEFTLFTDMDQSTPIEELDKLIPFTKTHKVIIGSRGMQRKNSPLYRQLASAIFGAVRKAILLPHINDTQCGFKLIHTQTCKRLFNKMLIFSQTAQAKGWTVAAWDVEFLFLAEKFGNPIKEVRVLWQNEDTSTSKNRTLTKFIYESLDMLRQVLRVRRNDLTGKYVR